MLLSRLISDHFNHVNFYENHLMSLQPHDHSHQLLNLFEVDLELQADDYCRSIRRANLY